jgi:hypothetical protein
MGDNEKQKESETRQLNAVIPVELMAKLNAEAFEKRTSMTAIIIEMLKERYKL